MTSSPRGNRDHGAAVERLQLSPGDRFHYRLGPWRRIAGQVRVARHRRPGAFGTVYKARDPELDRTVAIKVPHSGNLGRPQELDHFLREPRSVAPLRHPSIVTVHEVGQTIGLPDPVSDFAEGVTLADLPSARRPGFREPARLPGDQFGKGVEGAYLYPQFVTTP